MAARNRHRSIPALSLGGLAAILAFSLGTPGEKSDVEEWSFVREHIVMEVGQGEFQIDAKYVFKVERKTDDLIILYPFPTDSTLGRPILLNAWIDSGRGREPLHVLQQIQGWYWLMSAESAAKIEVGIRFRQAMKESRAVYVLRSAAIWDRPLEEATLEVRVPRGRRAIIQPKMVAAENLGEFECHRVIFKNWTPGEDLVVTLTQPGEPHSKSLKGLPLTP